MTHENRRKLVVAVFLVVCGASVHAQESSGATQTRAEPNRVAAPKAEAKTRFAWNRDDKYVPPDFEGYFPKEDHAAAKRLLDFLSSRRLQKESPAEFLDVVRRGLRSTKPKTSVLGRLGNAFIWNISPQNPAAIELMYHACGSPDTNVVRRAMYHGPTVVADRSDNLIRMMMLRNDKFDREIQERIHWGFKTYGDREKTARQLAKLLDEHEQIGMVATLAAYEAYKRLTGKEPPRHERFANLGSWAIGFHHGDVPAREGKGPDLLRKMLKEDLKLADDRLVDFVGRIDGDHWVGVALVSGLAEKERLAEQIKERKGFSVDFVEPLNERLFQTRRLGEFAKHWPHAVSHAKPTYTRPPLDAVYSWNREDRYEPSNFAEFFPDDEAAGRRLDKLYESRANPTVTDRELLDVFRQGLRRSSLNANPLFHWLATALGWPSDPYQIEIMYHASDPAAPPWTRYYAVYYGLGHWWKKSDNVLRLFGQILATGAVADPRQRILWSVRNDDHEKQFLAERIAETLGKHRDLDLLALVKLDEEYRELTGNTPPNRNQYAQRGTFLVAFRRSQARNEDQLEHYARSQFASSKHWLAFVTKKHQGEITGVAVVRGLAGRDWLLGELQKSQLNMIDGAWPYSKKVRERKPFVVDKATVSAASIGMKFVLIRAGEFMVGSSDDKAHQGERPQHRVRITRPFYLGMHEVTQSQYERVMGTNPSQFKKSGGDAPVETVSWDDAQEFCRKLSELPEERAAGHTYRLPTDAEWEYACRAGTKTKYSFGGDGKKLGDYAWWRGNSDIATHPVGRKKPNPWSLYDMHGNVLEWCADWYDKEYYAKSPAADPTGPDSGERRVLRSGSFDYGRPDLFRCTIRPFAPPDYRDVRTGFRVARTATP